MVAVPARAPAARRPLRRGRSRRGRAEQPAMVGGVVWIVLLAALLAGVVAINVALLQLNVRHDVLSRERERLRAENAALALQLSTAADPFEVESLVRTQLGYRRADPLETVYVDIGRR